MLGLDVVEVVFGVVQRERERGLGGKNIRSRLISCDVVMVLAATVV